MPDRAKLYVHCGLHKTGSTSLQAALRASEARLRAAGFLYPYAGSLDRPGRPSAAPTDSHHHNLAWHLSGSRFFDRCHGDVAALADEIAGFEGDVILSSEVFEWAIDRTRALDRLEDLAESAGRRLILILYLRNQIEYCDSLFFEMLKHGAGRSYASHAEGILATGQYIFQDWINHFDYDRALTTISDWAGAEIVVRNYHSLAGNSIITDFAALLGLGDALRPRAGHAAANRRLDPAESLALFHRNRIARRPTPAESARIRHIAARLGRLAMGADLRQRFTDRFAEGNRRLCARFGLPSAGLDLAPGLAMQAAPSLDDVFSFETQRLIAEGTAPVLPDWASGLDAAAGSIPPGAILVHRGRLAGKAMIAGTKTLARRLGRGAPG